MVRFTMNSSMLTLLVDVLVAFSQNFLLLSPPVGLLLVVLSPHHVDFVDCDARFLPFLRTFFSALFWWRFGGSITFFTARCDLALPSVVA